MDSVGELLAGYLYLPTTPIKQETQLTDWISGDLKPVRDGVYEREYYHTENSRAFCKFSNGEWYIGAWTIDDANSETDTSEYQNDRWRGLAKNTKVKS